VKPKGTFNKRRKDKVHLLNPLHKENETRAFCGQFKAREIVEDISLVTCELCLTFKRRGGRFVR